MLSIILLLLEPVISRMRTADCTFIIHHDTGCTRNPYNKTIVPDIATCCAQAMADPECAGWTFHPKGNVCFRSLPAGVIPGHESGVTCGTKKPIPPGPTPAPLIDPTFDCGIRRIALEYAGKVLSNRGQDSVFEALQLGPACGDNPPSPAPMLRSSLRFALPSSKEYWLSPNGNDNAAGTSAKTAWKTIARALKELEKTPAKSRPRTVIYLAPGYYSINKTLIFTAAHSGQSEKQMVSFIGTGTKEEVIISGGQQLQDLDWLRGPSGTSWYSATLPYKPKWHFESLFADGKRQLRARWPNGDPENYCARDLHGGHCPGFAQAGDKTTGTGQGTAVGPTNVNIFAKESGKLIAQGIMAPYTETHNFTISVPKSWYERKKTFSTFKAFEGGPLSRYHLNVTKAFWNTNVPMVMKYRKDGFTSKDWKRPEIAVLHTYQAEYWGSWQFRLAPNGVVKKNQSFIFSEGGFQEARGGSLGGTGGRGIAQDYFVENVFEELDSPREWYYDDQTSRIYWIPNTTKPLSSVQLFAPKLQKLVTFQGETKENPVANIEFKSISFRHSLPTFLEPFEPTSGGDWAIHRGAAVMLENAVNINLDGCLWAHNEGNGVIFSKYVRNSTVTNSEFIGTGETPIVMLGAANLMDGRQGTQPVHNTISHNYVHKWGVWNRQAAGYFEGISRANYVGFNVFHDGPRAGANFNDGFGGGLVFEGNLIFNVVQDTGEHGSTNSWARQPMLYLNDAGVLCTAPETRHIINNFVFRNSFRGATSNKWCLDKDDGSSNYLEAGNVLVYGAVKDRDGLQRVVSGNLFLWPEKMPFKDTTNTKIAMAFQVNEYQWDYFTNNTVVTSTGQIYQCTRPFSNETGMGFATMMDNIFMTPNNTHTPFSQQGCGNDKTFEQWQKDGYDKGSKITGETLTSKDILNMARKWLPGM